MHVKNLEKIRTLKALCVLSHYSFNVQFKEILKQLYRVQISQTRSKIPLERHVINFMEEIPLPDEGRLLVQHELEGQVVQFFRPTDQNPPIVGREEIENLFKCLDIDKVIEIFQCLLLEKKVLMISTHKALLTQVIFTLTSLMFPLQWKHTMIPILPINKLDILDAPMPYLIGVEPHP